MEDFDIYADLPDFGWLKQEYEGDVDVKKQQLPTSEKDVIELKTNLLKLEKVHKLVLSHYSSLWKTAKQERKRMERQIAELRNQLDNLAFKRNHRQTNRHFAPPPPLMLPLNAYSATTFQPPSNYQFNYLPPPTNEVSVEDQQVCENSDSYSPPATHSALTTSNHKWKQQGHIPNEHIVDNFTMPSNIITPENSHSSDESDDDIVKKSEYRSTVYGERLRKKLLEEKRNAAREKHESLLNEKKVNSSNLDHRIIQNSENVHKDEKLNSSKNADAASKTNEVHVETVKEENNAEKHNQIDGQNAKTPHKQQQLGNGKRIDAKDNVKNNELITEDQNDIGRKKDKEDYSCKKGDVGKKRTDENFKIERERDLYKRRKAMLLKIERDRDVEREREDKSRTRREKDLERKRKQEETDKAKQEEQLEKRRREEEIDKRRKDQEIERRKKEDIDRRRREEVDRRRQDEEIERRNEIEKRRRGEEMERRRNEELDKRKREESEKRRKESTDRKRKEDETERRKRDELNRRRREKETERRKKEEEQHAKKLKEIEKKRNEKQLEELIKERERIEKEMNCMNDEETEEEEIAESFNGIPCKEQSVGKKLESCKKELKETRQNTSKQFEKNQLDNRRNGDCKVGGRFTGSNCSRVTNQTTNDSRRKDYHGYDDSKSYRCQYNHTNKQRNGLRSRRDQLSGERERRKSSHRSKSSSRNRSNSAHRSEQDRGKYSAKRIKLVEKDRNHRNKLPDAESSANLRIIGKSPKRRRQTKSDERSPQNSKKRKMSPEPDLDCNIKSSENDVRKTRAQASDKLDETKNIIDSTLSNGNTSSGARQDPRISRDNMKKEEEKSNESLGKYQDDIPIKLSSSQRQDREGAFNDKRTQHTIDKADKKGTDHANKKELLINKLFEVQETPSDTCSTLKQVNKFQHNPDDETILSELEDGEITDSDESSNSENLPKALLGQSTGEPIVTVNLLEKNKFEIANSHCNELTRPLRESINEIAATDHSQVKDSILYNMLTKSENKNIEEVTKIASHEETSDKKEATVLKDKSDKSAACKETAIETGNTSSQMIHEKQVSPVKTSQIQCRVIKKNESIESNDLKKNVLSEVNKNKTISVTSDRINKIVQREKQGNGKKTVKKDTVKVKKTDCINSTQDISIPAASNVLLKPPSHNCLKVSSSENKIDSKEKLHSKRSELHSETNNTKHTCLKENVETSQHLVNKSIKQSAISERLQQESPKHVVKLSIPSHDKPTEKNLNTSPAKVTLTAVKKIIVIRRRRRPVQLSDSPPVVVINNVK